LEVLALRILANAFSLQMVACPATVKFEEVTVAEVARALSSGFTSAIGHADTAAVVGNILGVEVAMNRVSVSLTAETELYVAQVVGGRLPEGCTTLPEGVAIKFIRATIA
jgi:hypothetical protein